jgi:hypothetical protein|nr:hypothetical protein [Candidatus Sigynarchaeota archaeon]
MRKPSSPKSGKHLARRPPSRHIRITDKLATGGVKTTDIKVDKSGEVTGVTKSQVTKSKGKITPAFATGVTTEIGKAT